MTHVVVALDNITLRAEDVDSESLLALGIAVNTELENRRDKIAQQLSDLMIWGVAPAYLAQREGLVP